MSAVSHCDDNAACEGFCSVLKRERERERVHRARYHTLDIARSNLFDYIERFYNPRMRRRVAKPDLLFSGFSQTVRWNGVAPSWAAERSS